MILPRLNFQTKNQSGIVQNLGLNLTQNFRDGELRDGYGLTTSEFPALTQRRTWHKVDGEDGVTDIYEWDNKLAVIKNNKFYFDGDYILDVMPGTKKFAVVNTRLVIFPDKIYYDVSNGEHGLLENAIELSGHSNFTVTRSSISARPTTTEISDGVDITRTSGGVGHDNLLYVYESVSTLIECYNVKEHKWDTAKLSGNQTLRGTNYDNYDELSTCGMDLLKPNDIIIPQYYYGSEKYGIVDGWGIRSVQELPDISTYTQDSVFGIVNRVMYPMRQVNGMSVPLYKDHGQTTIGTINEGEVIEVYSAYYDSGKQWIFGKRVESGGQRGFFEYTDEITLVRVDELRLDLNVVGVEATYYSIDENNEPFNRKFKVGQAISIANTLLNNVNLATISGIDYKTNTITLISDSATSDVLRNPKYYYLVGESGLSPNLNRFLVEEIDAYIYFRNTSAIPGGSILYIDDRMDTVYVFDENTAEIIQKYPRVSASTPYRPLTFQNYVEEQLAITTYIPDLDFICSSGNRLWGVSNEKRTIYASALGDPSDFYRNMAQADGAWQVAVASDNEFTAIFPHVGNVYVFKEDRVIKVVGTNPAEYYTTEYEVAGVQKGSERSLVAINNTLYYKGVYNVYSFGGYNPMPIGNNLGSEKFTEGVGGTDYKNYYLHLTREDGSHIFLGFNIQLGIWIPLDKIPVDAVTTSGNILQILSEGFIYSQDGAGDDDTWMAEYCPFTDGTTQHKGLTKLLLCMDVEQGTTYNIDIKQDYGDWKRVYNGYATYRLTQWIPLRIGRCVRYAVRISGKGKAVLYEMKRESSIGGDR